MTAKNPPLRSPQGPESHQDDEQEPQGAQEPQDDEQEPQEDAEDVGGKAGNREAASYRRRLREAEAEVEALRARVEKQDAASFEALAAEQGVKAEALRAAGYTLESLTGEDGQVSPGKVRDAVHDATTRLGLSVRPMGYVAAHGTGDPGARAMGNAAELWADLLQRKQ